jgi:phage-related protein
MHNESPNVEVLEAISLLADNVQDISNGLQDLTENVQNLTKNVQNFQETTRNDFASLRSEMVTKSYLDDKLADVKGGMISILRIEDQKVNKLVSVLSEKSVISPSDTRDILSFKAFP